MGTKEQIKVMQAFVDGKRIETRYRGTQESWSYTSSPSWDWYTYDYRIAPEPKKEGQWERKEIRIDDGDYVIVWSEEDWIHLSRAAAMPGFGGIDYKSPFNPKVVVRSMVPVMFEETGGWATFDFAGHFRPGIPVAAWFWREK